MTSIPFFLKTWEEYYTGELNFPIIHGVSEGTVVACLAMHATGFLGRDIWFQNIPIMQYQFQMNHIIVSSSFLWGLLMALVSLADVVAKFKDKRRDTIENLLIFIYLILTLFIVVLLSDSNIVKYHPKLVIVLYGFAFAKLVAHLQLAHLADSKFLQFRKSLLSSFLILGSITLIQYYMEKTIINIDSLIIFFLFVHIIGI